MATRKSILHGRDDHIRLLRARGLTQEEAADVLCVTLGALKNYCSKIGVSWSRELPIEEYAPKVMELARQGYCKAEVSRALGISDNGIRKIADRFNIRFASGIRHRVGKPAEKPKPKPQPTPDKMEVVQAIDFMRRHYPNVYREKTLGVNRDLIICGSQKLTQSELVKKARKLGFNPKL